MNNLGGPLQIPAGGFPMGQSRLIEGARSGKSGDVRLLGLLNELVRRGASRPASANLQLVDALVCRAFPEAKLSPFLVMTTAYREWAPSVTDRSTTRLNTYDRGGLDYLAANKARLGLPKAITDLWNSGGSFENEEIIAKKSIVHPAEIPRMHQLLAYAAQTRLSFFLFTQWLQGNLPAFASGLSHGLSTLARRVWQAYAFLAPGGQPHLCGSKPRHGQSFGVHSAAGFLDCLGKEKEQVPSLNDVVTETALHHTYFVLSAKMRTVESIFFEHLLDRAGYAESPP